MNININSNYQSPAFGNKRFLSAKIIEMLQESANVARYINGISAAEINGRVSVQSKSSSKKLASLIKNEPALINNKSIQDNLDNILIQTDSNLSYVKGGMSLCSYIEEKAYARLRVLEAYKDNKQMLKNPIINERIGSLVSSIKKNEQANCLISVLESGIKNDDVKYFDSLENMLRDNIQPELIKKVLSDEKLYKNIESATLYNMLGTEKAVIERINRILDTYLEKYSDCQSVTTQLNQIINESYKQLKEDPTDYAFKKFQEAAGV